jgi:hypothetical protein
LCVVARARPPAFPAQVLDAFAPYIRDHRGAASRADCDFALVYALFAYNVSRTALLNWRQRALVAHRAQNAVCESVHPILRRRLESRRRHASVIQGHGSGSAPSASAPHAIGDTVSKPATRRFGKNTCDFCATQTGDRFKHTRLFWAKIYQRTTGENLPAYDRRKSTSVRQAKES